MTEMAVNLKHLVLYSLIGLFSVVMTGQTMAQTIGYADAIKILSSSCGKDINKYCPKANLGNNEIRNCLIAHEAEVSPTCKADYVKVYASITARFAAQESAQKICARDIERFCTGMKRAKGYTLQCLLNKPRLGKKCKQVLIDAGWAN
jgi:hypothetical protein